MLRPRIIPCLLVHDRGLVKTTKFKDPKYVGDPINAVKIFNEKEVDELTVLDIDATVNKAEPDYNMIRILASECRMPLCYGGGVKTLEQAKRIVQLGVEKVALSSAAIDNPGLITEIANAIGTQSVVVVLDIKKKFFGKKYEVWTHNGKVNTGKCPIELAKQLQDAGAGEVVVNMIDKEGTQKGFDLDIAKDIKDNIHVPFTIMGGAGDRSHFEDAAAVLGIAGIAAGSFFVFKGIYKAVLISYLPDDVKNKLAKLAFETTQKSLN